MEKINGFTFYLNYYELIKYLDPKNKRIMLEAIVDYMFEGIEPELDGQNKGIWMNIVMPLTKSKNNSLRSKGAPDGNQNASKKTNQKQTGEQTKNKPENKPKTNQTINQDGNQKQTNSISYFLFLISNFYEGINKRLLREKIEEWLNYKWERKEYYKETGFKSLLTQIDKNVQKYGEQKVIDLITNCMGNNYKGIIFEKLEKNDSNKKVVPKQNDEVMDALGGIYDGSIKLE